MSKTLKSFRLDDDLLFQLTDEAISTNRKLSNYVEHLLFTHPMRVGSKNKCLKRLALQSRAPADFKP